MTQSTLEFSWRVREETDRVVVDASGELDVYWAPAFRDALIEVADDITAPRLEVDLGGVTFVDSTGLGVLVGLRRRLLNRRVEMFVVNPSRATHKALEASGLLGHFNVVFAVDDV